MATLSFFAFVVIPVASAGLTLLGVAAKGTAAISTLAALGDLLNVNNLDSLKAFDMMGMTLTSKALMMLANFMYYARLLVSICAFLCLIINSIKLWFSAVELRRFYVDTTLKCLIVMVLMFTYPKVVTTTFDFATKLGTEGSGGSDIVMESFGKLADRISKVWEDGVDDMCNVLQNGVSDGGKVVISESLLEEFMKNGLTKEEALNWAEQKGYVVSNKQTSSEKKKERNAKKLLKNDKKKQKYMKQSLGIMRALSDVLTGSSENEISSGKIDVVSVLNNGKEALNNVFYNPYINGTTRLSFSSMIKTALLIAEITSQGSLAALEEADSSKKMSWDEMSKARDSRLIVKFISWILTSKLVYKIMMLVCVLFIMIEYILCLVEYYIAAAVSALFIPLFFIDATKQYAVNILKTLLSYAVKIIVTTMMCFFVISMYIELGSMMIQKDLSSTLCVLLYASVLLMGIMLSQSAGKIAGGVISGNPSVGLGDVARQIHNGFHMARTAEHMMGSAAQGVKSASEKVQKAGGNMATYNAAQDSVLEGQRVASRTVGEDLRKQRDSANSTVAGLREKMANGYVLTDAENDQLAAAQGLVDMTDKQIDAAATQAGKDYAKQARKDFNKDWMYKNLTGMDSPNANSSNALRVGQQFWDAEKEQWRTANWIDVQNAGKKGGQQFGEQAAQDAIRRNSRQMCGDIELPECNGH